MSGLSKKLFLCSILISNPAVVYGESTLPDKNVPPIADKTERAKKPQANPTKQQNISIELPPSINLTVGGKLGVETNAHETHGNDEPSNTPEWLVAIFTGFLVIVTGYLVHYTKRLWGATGQLVIGSEITAQRQLRAYVGCDRIRILNLPIRGVVDIKNFGKTMAKDVEIRLAATVHEVGTAKFALGQPKGRLVIMPGETTGWEEKVGAYDSELLRLGGSTIYVWGRIDYTDAFGERRWTTFRFENDGILRTNELTGQPLTEWHVKACQEGNDAY